MPYHEYDDHGYFEGIKDELRSRGVPKYMHYFAVHVARFNRHQIRHLRNIVEIIENRKGYKND
jgi:hypothetical protein